VHARIYKASRHPGTLARPRVRTPMIDKCAIVTLAACVYALIVFHLLTFLNPPTQEAVLSGTDARPENRIFWPVMAIISVILVAQNRDRFARLTWPPHLVCLFAYLALAGASALWAFRPEAAFIRFAQEAMIVASIVLPTMLAARTADIVRGLFLCFAFASILNFSFVLAGTATIVTNAGAHGSFQDYLGSPGYFPFKNYLGECAAIALLLSIYEILHHGWRRALGIIVLVIDISLIFSSDSKTALGLAIIAPTLAGFTLIARKITRLSPAIILLSIVFFYFMLSIMSPSIINSLGYRIFHDATFSGRTLIWDFAQYEIERRPLLGWGYESFWLVPGSPSSEAPGYWIKMMPNAHNGYVDTKLELGYVGLAFLVVFIVATLHAIGRVVAHDPARAWLVLSLALFIIIYNFLETLWMHGFEFLWVVFVIVAADIGRYWRPLPLNRAAYRSRSPSPSPGRSQPFSRRDTSAGQ